MKNLCYVSGKGYECPTHEETGKQCQLCKDIEGEIIGELQKELEECAKLNVELLAANQSIQWQKETLGRILRKGTVVKVSHDDDNPSLHIEWNMLTGEEADLIVEILENKH